MESRHNPSVGNRNNQQHFSLNAFCTIFPVLDLDYMLILHLSVSCSTRRRTTPSFFLLLCISFPSRKDVMAAEATSYPLLWCRLPMDCSPWENMGIIGYLWAAALLTHPSAVTQVFPGWNEGIGSTMECLFLLPA